MKNLLVSLLLFGFISSTNAAFINNGDNTISDDVSGLDWLSLSVTVNQAYSEAETLNTGWRYATNDEVVNLFNFFFSTFVSNNSNGTSFSGTTDYPISTYAAQEADIATFQSYFGATPDGQTFGLYKDEDNILRVMGAYWGTNAQDSGTTNVIGDEANENLNAYITTSLNGYSTYVVRSVPDSSSIYLLAFGLLSLFGASGRKV